MAGLVDITKGSCGLGASQFGEPDFPVLAIGIWAQAQGSCLHKEARPAACWGWVWGGGDSVRRFSSVLN